MKKTATRVAHAAAPAGSNWRQQRRTGSLVILASAVIAATIWLAIRFLAPPLPPMMLASDRLAFAFKWWALAVLFCFATGIDAVAHERLQSPGFDPLAGYETRRLRVNLRYLQNTLEQLIMFTAGLFGLALYSRGGDGMRAVEATAVVWILFRFAFWIGYHRSAAMRSIGAPSIALSLIVLIYVAAHISYDLGGKIAALTALTIFAGIEVFLFWTTRFREDQNRDEVR
jgi:MAPEG family protein